MEDRDIIRQQQEIENSLHRFTIDTNLQECCQSLLDVLSIKYIIIDPSTQSAEFFFRGTALADKSEILGRIKNMSVVGVATQDTFLTNKRLTITREEMERQLRNHHYKEMVFLSFDTTEPFTRAEISMATRAINKKMFNKPVVLFIRCGNLLSITTCERTNYIRAPKTPHGEKVGMVTILRNIDCLHPHHGHISILSSLDASGCEPSFDALYRHWLETFNSELLTKKFYQELSDWYAWAIKNVSFPNSLDDSAKRETFNNENVIRLVTRLIFVWFLKEKHLIPEELFDESFIVTNLVRDFDPNNTVSLFFKSTESRYYKAILQNLFFATLNCPIIDPETGEMNNRHFGDGRADDGNSKVMKHKDYFINPDLFVELVNKTVPFLNGGLFDCLDDSPKRIFFDGFSDKEEICDHLIIPDYLFFLRNFVLLSAIYMPYQYY